MTPAPPTRNAHRLDDISKARTEDVTSTASKNSFADLHLGTKITEGLSRAGYDWPSPVQWSSLPLARLGVDLVVQAKSGTGKTLVFVITSLNMINLDANNVQVLLVAPTREIAVQAARSALDVAAGSKMDDLKVHTFIGGMSMSDDVIKVKRCHIAVGSPGRLRALMEGGHMKADSVRLFVLDEADKLMEDSFRSDITWIFNKLPANKQVMALSATYPDTLASVIAKYMNCPQHVRLNQDCQVLRGVAQYAMTHEDHVLDHVEAKHKFSALLKILTHVSFGQCLVFSNYSVRAESICEKLEANGWPTEFLAATMGQEDRLRALHRLKQSQCRVLITTDLSARGIDAANVNLVINMEPPWEPSTYLHRIGRAGRFGSYGVTVTLVSKGKEYERLQHITYKTGSDIRLITGSEETLPDLWKIKQDNLEEELLYHLPLIEPAEHQESPDQLDRGYNGDKPVNTVIGSSKTSKSKKRGKKKNLVKEEEIFKEYPGQENCDDQNNLGYYGDNDCDPEFEGGEYDQDESTGLGAWTTVQSSELTHLSSGSSSDDQDQTLNDEFILDAYALATGFLAKALQPQIHSWPNYVELVEKVKAVMQKKESGLTGFEYLDQSSRVEFNDKRAKRFLSKEQKLWKDKIQETVHALDSLEISADLIGDILHGKVLETSNLKSLSGHLECQGGESVKPLIKQGVDVEEYQPVLVDDPTTTLQWQLVEDGSAELHELKSFEDLTLSEQVLFDATQPVCDVADGSFFPDPDAHMEAYLSHNSAAQTPNLLLLSQFENWRENVARNRAQIEAAEYDLQLGALQLHKEDA